MALELATIEDLRKAFTGRVVFPEAKAEELTEQLAVASAHIRRLLQLAGKDLDAEILSGELDLLLVKNIVVSMVYRTVVNAAAGLEVAATQFSQGAGPYSVSLGGLNSGMYLRKEEKKLLGLSTARRRLVKMYGSSYETRV